MLAGRDRARARAARAVLECRVGELGRSGRWLTRGGAWYALFTAGYAPIYSRLVASKLDRAARRIPSSMLTSRSRPEMRKKQNTHGTRNSHHTCTHRRASRS
eukprot:2910003-Prymnesium_polylepis.1